MGSICDKLDVSVGIEIINSLDQPYITHLYQVFLPYIILSELSGNGNYNTEIVPDDLRSQFLVFCLSELPKEGNLL
jgi:hypothetical protein